MNLKNFENQVEPKILDRGCSYYENDQVEDIEQIEEREFSATVLGSDEYTVLIKLSKDLEILSSSCDCPYDWGNICKHEVAVLYYLKDSEKYKDFPRTGKISKMKSELGKYTKEELKALIIEIAKKNRKFREEILWYLGDEEI